MFVVGRLPWEGMSVIRFHVRNDELFMADPTANGVSGRERLD
jgi:hypothetical protein